MRAWAKNLRRRSHEAKTLLGTSPEQRNRSIPSGLRFGEASGWLRFPPLWETSGLSLVAVGSPPMGDVCVVCDVWCGVLCCVLLWCVEVYGVLC